MLLKTATRHVALGPLPPTRGDCVMRTASLFGWNMALHNMMVLHRPVLHFGTCDPTILQNRRRSNRRLIRWQQRRPTRLHHNTTHIRLNFGHSRYIDSGNRRQDLPFCLIPTERDSRVRAVLTCTGQTLLHVRRTLDNFEVQITHGQALSPDSFGLGPGYAGVDSFWPVWVGLCCRLSHRHSLLSFFGRPLIMHEYYYYNFGRW